MLMRKSYIFWWAVSAYCVFGIIYNLYNMKYFYDYSRKVSTEPVLWIAALIGLVTFYVGYRRFQEYKEYQEDRKIRNEFYKSNTKEEDK